jgi:hypothetical protein
MRSETLSEITVDAPEQSIQFRLSVWQDQDSENPRSWDNRGTLVFRDHRRYSLPKECNVDLDDEADVLRWGEKHWLWPLSSYEHGNITFSLGKATCRWDGADNVGLVMIPKELDGKPVDEDKAYAIAEAELETFNEWMNGSVYGFTVEKLATYVKTYADGSEQTGEEWLDVESCGGYYGYSHEKSGLLDAANEALRSYCTGELNMRKEDVPAFKE